MLPALALPWTDRDGRVLPVASAAGLNSSAIDSLRTTFPGTLTPEHERLLSGCCGVQGTPLLQYLDFTGQWHDEETLAVFRPCLTLAVDTQGRRWIAETGHARGLPGPVWCVVSDPEVVVYVCADLSEFLSLLRQHACDQSMESWLRGIDIAAHQVWRSRGALAFQSRQACGHDRHVREWLLQLPRDSRVYDLRSPSLGAGWPYGVAGPAGRFHRCGRELLFAVSGFPAPSRWTEYLGNLAQHHQAPAPAVIAFERGRIARTAARAPLFARAEERSCA
jgi:hypothetical protein